MDVALIIVTVLFVLALLWRVRPLLPLARKEEQVALKVAKDRIESAKDHEARAATLCDAEPPRQAQPPGQRRGVLPARPARGAQLARGRHARRRGDEAMAAHPRRLLWRTLAAAPWSGEGERAAASKVALERLADLTKVRSVAGFTGALCGSHWSGSRNFRPTGHFDP